jgi:hypothetical protein
VVVLADYGLLKIVCDSLPVERKKDESQVRLQRGVVALLGCGDFVGVGAVELRKVEGI